MRLENDDPEWAKADWRSCWYNFSCINPYEYSNRCGVLIDGEFVESQTGLDKITFECGCLEKEIQDIVWGFVVSEHREAPSTPSESSLVPVQRVVPPRVKVVMQRHRIRVENLLSDSLSAGSSSEQQPQQERVAYLRGLELTAD